MSTRARGKAVNLRRPAATADKSTSEFALQVAIVELLERAGTPGVVWFHVPNGEKRSKSTGAKLKRMGVRPGVADLVFIGNGGVVRFLELKASDGIFSPDQLTFCHDVEWLGALYAVARSIDDAIRILSAWGAIRTRPAQAA